MASLPSAEQPIAVTHFIVSDDVARSRAFYADVLGAEVVREGEPSILQFANSWIIINVGGGPTEDKPDVVLEAPTDPNRVSAFLNLRVADIHSLHEEWSARGAEFLTRPMQRATEIRCYLRDPDGHLIEVGQWTPPPGAG
jgi:catechol 2,3-dioxygenase-like lactoylglutathione lyase family enzyme